MRLLFVIYVIFSSPVLFVLLFLSTDFDTAIKKLEEICSIALGDDNESQEEDIEKKT